MPPWSTAWRAPARRCWCWSTHSATPAWPAASCGSRATATPRAATWRSTRPRCRCCSRRSSPAWRRAWASTSASSTRPPARQPPSRPCALIGSALDGRGPVLWIVDDLHPGLSADVLQDWLAPGNLNEAMSLVTSRSTEYDYGVARLTLDSLAPVEALWLLTKDQPPADDAQRDAARQLVELLGGHPLAIDVTRRHQRARRLREVVGANERRRGGRAGPPGPASGFVDRRPRDLDLGDHGAVDRTARRQRESCSPRWPAMRRCRSR